MKYIAVDNTDAHGLSVQSMPRPSPANDEVLIRVHAAGVNRPDLLQRTGLYPPPAGASSILGLEVAGEIVACGSQVTEWFVGEQVCALVNGGGYAEYVAVPAAQCLLIPQGFSFTQAAALPETFFTVWHNLWQRAHLESGENLLIHGGASGIGTTAIQLAASKGVHVYTTVSSAEKAAVCEQLGATAINYQREDFVAVIKEKTQGHGVDVILDMVGGDYIQRNFSAAAQEARIVNIAFAQGSKVDIDLMPVMLKRLTLTGSTLRAQSAAVKANIARELKQFVWPLLSTQVVKPVLDSVFPFADVELAHARMESNQHIGKIVLDVTLGDEQDAG